MMNHPVIAVSLPKVILIKFVVIIVYTFLDFVYSSMLLPQLLSLMFKQRYSVFKHEMLRIPALCLFIHCCNIYFY